MRPSVRHCRAPSLFKEGCSKSLLLALSAFQSQRSFSCSARKLEQQQKQTPPANLITSVPYSALTIGIPFETYPQERRVSLTPQNTALLLKKGFSRVLVERGAGAAAQFTDQAYEAAGATLADRGTVWADSDILLKVRAPLTEGPDNEVQALREGSTLLSFLYPAQNKGVVDALAQRRVTSFAMDMIPRISRAQVFDALSSMANIAGYKAILEASNHFGRFLPGQVTAAG
ncbi:hypothetical protein FQN57_005160 [Myotisia sp. PD_48]|nr:hypothetical protein FQN57_005160 [Myotisia sp. PD_48]